MDRSRHFRRLAALLSSTALVLATALVASCGHDQPPVHDDSDTTGPITLSPAAGEAWPEPAVCDLMPGEPERGGSLVLALGQGVDAAHAPVPVNDAERTVFANLYETLTVVGCTGELRAGLAESWERHDDGRRWRLRIRNGAVFWDGTPVGAVDVVAAWSRNESLARDIGRPCPGLWIASGSRGLAVLDARTLEIRLAEPQDDLPRLLAHPGLAVALQRPGWHWPVGSGPCRLAADTGRALPDLVCRPNLHHPRAPVWKQFTFRILADGDPRDRLAAGVDLAVIRDRRAAAYYDELAEIASAALPWDRIYALLVPPGREIDARAAALAASQAVTPAESRPWQHLDFHGCGPAACPQLHGPTVGVVTPPRDPDQALLAMESARLYHAGGDPDARALAERALAFAATDLTLRPSTGVELARSLQHGDAGAYVVALDASYPTACLTAAALVARADWLQQELDDGDDACQANEQLRTWRRAIPLIQTRARLLWRSPLAGLDLTHDGALLVAGLGRAPAEATP